MKLQLTKSFSVAQTEWVYASKVISPKECVFLTATKGFETYQLLVVSSEEMKVIDLIYPKKALMVNSEPVLFAIGEHFGVVKSADELLLFSDKNTSPQSINIENRGILPQRTDFRYASPVSDSHLLALGFEKEVFMGAARYVAFLEVNVETKTARWVSQTQVDSSVFPYHIDAKYPPKIDSLLLKNNELYVFTSGGKTTSVMKWGMDYYALLCCDLGGKVTEILLGSGHLHAIDSKKRGVNGVFSSSGEYLILTPLFQNDEWKGKQRLLSLSTGEMTEIALPRGVGKGVKIIDHFGAYFWLYLPEKSALAMCSYA